MVVKQSWIGRPIGRNKPHDFFKTNKKNYPSYMFKDNDRDGVANVFDCNPNDPLQQGIVSAVIGAIGGIGKGKEGMKAGWRKGMAAPTRRERKIQKFATNPAEKIRSSLPGQPSSYERYKQLEKTRAAKIQRYKEQAGKVSSQIQRRVNVLRDYQIERKKQIQTKSTPKYIQRRIQAQRKLIGMVYPGMPKKAFEAVEGKYQGKTGKQGRGRPKGSFKYPGGVFEYRKLMRAQRAAARYQTLLQRSRALQTMPQMMAARQMQLQQRQSPQVPQEVQGAVPEYSQFPGYEQQVQQVPQQIPQRVMYQQEYVPEIQERPIATVFRGSGNKPYPAVDRRPLTPSRETVPQGFVESVDSFTGKRIIKKLPTPERWAVGGY